MKKYEKKCYNCGNVDRFTIKEMRNLHFCQRCYKQHDTMCDVFANSVLELEQQNKRYKQALEYIQREIRKAIYTPKKQKWNSDFEREFESGKTRGLIQASDIVKEAIEILEGEK